MRLKIISWKYMWLFKNIPQKWFCADNVDVRPLKTLKKLNVSTGAPFLTKWNIFLKMKYIPNAMNLALRAGQVLLIINMVLEIADLG